MKRKTLILREDQFNEICGLNTSYLDNPSDFAKDGTLHTRTDGAVSDSFGGEEDYSEPMTGDDYSDSMAPETLWAVLFRNGGHGLWGHWGSGMRTSHLSGIDKAFTDEFEDDEVYNNFPDDENFRKELTEEIDGPTNDYLDWDEQVYYEALRIMKNFDFGRGESIDAVEHIIDVYVNSSNPDNKLLNMEPELAARYVAREAMKSIDPDYYDSEVRPFFNLQESKKNLHESNSELEGRSWNGNSYTNLTTKKTQYKQQLAAMRNSNAPAQQIKRVQAAYNAVSGVLNRETGAIKARKTARKNMGMPNQFQKPGGTKNSGNGKAHTRKKIIDPNVGTGFITYK